jgi:SPOR domain
MRSGESIGAGPKQGPGIRGEQVRYAAMLEGSLNRRWQVLLRFIMGLRPSNSKIRRPWKLGRKKPSLVVAVGKRREGNALQEYQRRFASMAPQGPEPPPGVERDRSTGSHPALDSFHQKAKPAKATKRLWLIQIGRRRLHRLKEGASGGWGRIFRAGSHTYVALAGLKPRRREWIAVTLVFATAIGGAYAYRTMKAGADKPLRTADTATAREEQPVSQAYSKKLFQDRLTASDPETAAAPPALPGEDAGPQGALKETPVHAAATEARNEPSSVPAVSPPASGEKPAGDAPTVVRSERYSPDGTRTDLAAAPVAASTKLAALEPNSAPPAPQAAAPQQVSLEEPGYFAQIRSDPNKEAAEAEVANLMEKYKAVLGEVPLKTRQADLKEKGIWFRVLAGPLKTYGDADSLCKKMKKAGLQACIVQKLD